MSRETNSQSLLQNKTRTKWIRDALQRYETPLIRCAVRITGNTETARDVVQDTFIRLCKTDREKVEGHLAAWLFTVCRNRALDVARKEGRMGQLFDPLSVADRDTGNMPNEIAQQKEMYQLIRRAVSNLPAEQQEAFMLKFQDELSYREISSVMNKSLGTVSKLLSSALGTIRRQLRGKFDLVKEG